MRRIPFLIGQDRDEFVDPDRFAILVEVSVFDLEEQRCPGLQLADCGQVSVPVLRMNQGAEGDLAQLLFGVAEQGRIGWVALRAAPPSP